jgi:hypothetical protein
MPCRSLSRTYGTVSADEQKEMSGLEFVQGLANGKLPLNTIAQTLGYDVTEAENGRVVVAAEPCACISIRGVRCTAVSQRRCSTVAWD